MNATQRFRHKLRTGELPEQRLPVSAKLRHQGGRNTVSRADLETVASGAQLNPAPSQLGNEGAGVQLFHLHVYPGRPQDLSRHIRHVHCFQWIAAILARHTFS